MSHLDAYKAQASASPFFLLKVTRSLLKNTTCWLVMSHFLRMASECSTSQKLSLRSFYRNYWTIKDGAQTYDLFFIILKVLSGRDVIRTQGKCIKSYKNFWEDFVVEQNISHPKGDSWSYLNHTYKIVVIWDDGMIGNMDPCHCICIDIVRSLNDKILFLLVTFGT